MELRRVVALSTMFATVAISFSLGAVAEEDLPPKLKTALSKVSRAYAEGDLEGVWHALVPGLIRAKPETLETFNRELEARKLPPLGELLGEARLRLVMQGREAALPVPDLHERLLLVPALGRNVAIGLKRMEEHPLLRGQAPAPVSMEEFEQRFNTIQSLSEMLWLAECSALFGLDLASKISASSKKKLTDEEHEAIELCNQDVLDSVRDAQRDLPELQVETHLERLAYGLKVLEKPELSKERFLAAATTRLDASVVLQQLAQRAGSAGGQSAGGAGTGTPSAKTTAMKGKSKPAKAAVPLPPPPAFRRPTLLRNGLVGDVLEQKRRAEQLAGPLADKASRFFQGVEWWLRGRYGVGVAVNGLVKSEEGANDPTSRSDVSMPPELHGEVSAGNSVRPAITHLDRRHHYVWAWEDRTFKRTTTRGKTKTVAESTAKARDAIPWPDHRTGVVRPNSWFLLATPYETTVQLPPQDPRLVFRIVGFMEYGKALEALDGFVREASIAEFEIAEGIVREQDTLAIETNLSRKLERTPGPLSEQPATARDDFQRRGLAWMLALARVELGAMLAGFTSHANPFLGFAPASYKAERVQTRLFGMAEFSELLLDGLRTHFCALMNDPTVQSYYQKGVPEEHLVTHSRRAVVGRELLRAVRELLRAGAAAPQRGELEKWDAAFQKLQRVMLYCLTKKSGSERTVVYQRIIQHDHVTSTETERSPDAIGKLLETIDPTLVGCPCR